MLLHGMTAHALTEGAYRVHSGDRVLVHGAAGGVGALLVQLSKRRGGMVIGAVSSPEKAAFVRELGADHVIVTGVSAISVREDGPDRYNFEAATRRITEGAGVAVVYDSVGRSTFYAGLRLLRSRGHMVVYGLSSGNIPAFDLNRLSGITGAAERGSLFVTWATLNDYNATRRELVRRAGDVVTWAGNGTISVRIAERLPLREARRAHELLEQRRVIGRVLLLTG